MTTLALSHAKTASFRRYGANTSGKSAPKNVFRFISRNPLKSLVSDEESKEIQTNSIAQNRGFRSERARRQENPNQSGGFAAAKAGKSSSLKNGAASGIISLVIIMMVMVVVMIIMVMMVMMW